MDIILSEMSKVTNQEASVNGIPSNERPEVGERTLPGTSLNEHASTSRRDDLMKHGFDSSLTSLLPKETKTQQQQQMPMILPQLMAPPLPATAPTPGPGPATIAPAGGGGGAITPGVASVSNSLSPTPIAASALPGNNAKTTTIGIGAMPDMTAFAGTTAQQQLIWQHALQSLNLYTVQQPQQQQHQQQTPFAGAAPGIPLNLSFQAMLPVLAAAAGGGQQQQQQQQPVAPTTLTTIMPIPIASAAPSVSSEQQPQTSSDTLKRSALGNLTMIEPRTAKRIKIAPPPPSVISSYDSNASDACPPIKMSDSELAKLSPAERRRYERNLREQQRSYKISQQIKSLRDVLNESNVPFKPNKYSILVTVTNYIKELQARSIMLDADHKRLRDTIKQTNELVASGQILCSEESTTSGENNNYNNKYTATSVSSSSPSPPPDTTTPDFLMVQGVDFMAAFKHCPYALGVCSLDGRIMACNAAFERVMGCDEGEMEEQSLFLYIRNHQEIFEAMADLLKRSSIASETGVEAVKDLGVLYWCGNVVSSNEIELALSITLTNVANGIPKFFSFSIATVG